MSSGLNMTEVYFHVLFLIVPCCILQIESGNVLFIQFDNFNVISFLPLVLVRLAWPHIAHNTSSCYDPYSWQL